MLAAETVVGEIERLGYTHIVWIPDSHLGQWEACLQSSDKLQLLRVCREGEAIGMATGLMLGLAKPLVIIQCTGFFEAGDALRNAVHDLGLPLKMIVGVRGWLAKQAGAGKDNCAHFTEPVAAAWDIPIMTVNPNDAWETIQTTLQTFTANPSAAILLWRE